MPVVPTLHAHALDRVERLVASLVAATLYVGVGMLGWLAGHLLTYDAVGASAQHAHHEYMHPVEQGGTGFATAGVLLVLVLLLLGRHHFTAWVRAWLDDGSLMPWIGAATVPAAAYVAVQLVEGAGATTVGAELLALGVPLQALLGLGVLWLVRALIGALVDVADGLFGSFTGVDVASRVHAPLPSRASFRRASPMAGAAPRRGPPPSFART